MNQRESFDCDPGSVKLNLTGQLGGYITTKLPVCVCVCEISALSWTLNSEVLVTTGLFHHRTIIYE